MKLVVVAEPPAEFAAWVADQQQPAAALASAQERQGRDVFVTQECASCHMVRGGPGTGGDGPDLTHVASRPTLGAGSVSNTPPHLAEWVTDPHAIKEGVAMPSVDLTDEELDDLLAYLGSLR
jgi:cytochrome c oxidase subunit 2